MRRRVTLVLAFALPLAAYSLVAFAQQPKPATGAKGAASGSASGAAATAPATSASGAAAPSSSAGAPAATGVATSAGTGTVASPSAGGAAPADSGMNGATYAVRLRDLESRVDELKDQIRRSHTRLALLSDTIIGGGMAGSRSEIDFKNEMSSAFLLTKATFVLDGQIQYNRSDDTGALADQKEIPVYSGTVQPGDHTIQVALTFQGNGYGVFSYLRGYKFDVKSSHAFTAVEGKTLSIIATAFEKGGVTTPLEQRPTIEWQEKVQALGGGSAVAAPGGGGAAPGAPGGASVSGSVNVGGGKK